MLLRLAKTASTLSALRKMAGLLSTIGKGIANNPGKTAVGVAAGVGGVKQTKQFKKGFDPAIHNQLAGPITPPPGGP